MRHRMHDEVRAHAESVGGWSQRVTRGAVAVPEVGEVVVVAGDDRDVQQLARGFGIHSLFDFILTSAACSYRKPHPRIFEIALANWYLLPAEAVMVGDNLTADIKGAQNVGIYGIWINRRADPASETQERVKPDASISSLSELPAMLDKLQVK